jgi:hypothetical protein
MTRSITLSLCILLNAATSYPQDSAAISALVNQSKLSFEITDNKPAGKGWDLLAGQFAENNFVGWGEYHNSPLMSVLTNEALKVAAENKYGIWCTEIGLYAARDLYKIATDKKFYNYMKTFNKTYGIEAYTAYPFFRSAEDSMMLQTAIKKNISVWGIDQEYQLVFPYHLTMAYNNLPPQTKAANKGLFDSIMVQWYFPKSLLLDSLKKLVTIKEDKDRLNEIILSKAIYGSQGEDSYTSNQDRAKVMRVHFYKQLAAYRKTTAQAVKVFFKMGSNHLAKGFNLETHLLDMGNLAYEMAAANGSSYSNVQFVPRFYKNKKGEIKDELSDKESDCSQLFLQQYQQGKWVVIDMRPLRGKLLQDKTLDEKTYEIIEKYDVIVISPEIK